MRCTNRGAEHSGPWAFCPYDGRRLPEKRAPEVPGICRWCGGPAAWEWSSHCLPCWYPRLAARKLNGHAPAELAALVAEGKSWKEIASSFGLPRPRRGPRDVEEAGHLLWQAAGAPGAPAVPEDRLPRKERFSSPVWQAFVKERERVMRAWLSSRAADAARSP